MQKRGHDHLKNQVLLYQRLSQLRQLPLRAQQIRIGKEKGLNIKKKQQNQARPHVGLAPYENCGDWGYQKSHAIRHNVAQNLSKGTIMPRLMPINTS